MDDGTHGEAVAPPRSSEPGAPPVRTIGGCGRPGAGRVAGRGLIGRGLLLRDRRRRGLVFLLVLAMAERLEADDLALERLAQVRVRGLDLGEDGLELGADQLVRSISALAR